MHAIPAIFRPNPVVNLTHSVVTKQEKLRLDMMREMDAYVVGQDEAKKALIDAVLNGLFNVCREDGALGAVFLAGPTGVGKTALVRTLARILLGNPEAFTKVTGETMQHPTDVSRLTGSGAGFIGYGDAPDLADLMVHSGYKRAKEKKTLHPIISGYEGINFSIVLFDEVEKAYHTIPNTFLNAIQSGEMEMSSGYQTSDKFKHSKYTDFSNTLFVFTSNIGEHAIASSKNRTIGFTDARDTSGDNALFDKEMKQHFAPEFIGRMDSIVRCHSLTEAQIKAAFNLNIERMNGILARRNEKLLRILATDSFVEHTLLYNKKGPEYGARAITSVMRNIGSQVGLALRSGIIPQGAEGVIQFDVQHNALDISFRKEAPKLGSNTKPIILSDVSIMGRVEDIVAGKTNQYGDKVKSTVHAYIDIVAQYASEFEDERRLYLKRLQGYGFNVKDIDTLDEIAYTQLYQGVEQPEVYEILHRGQEKFAPIGFRALEKFIHNAIEKNFTLQRIYLHIRGLLSRTITESEGTVIAQHIHRVMVLKNTQQS